MKRQTHKRVTLPNGSTFVPSYEPGTHNHLPANIRLEQLYRQRVELRVKHRVQ